MTATWLAAQYHLPSTYMCRMPMSSPVAARALPTPGPATIRLALIRNAIELFGIATTRDRLFPVIRAMAIRIQPPQQVAISRQQLKRFKGGIVNGRPQLQDALGYCEVAIADGFLTIYLQVGGDVVPAIVETLYAIGAWGSADSFAFCENVEAAELPDEVVVQLQSMSREAMLSQRYIGHATEFRDQSVTWDEIIVGNSDESPDGIVCSLWVWPLCISEQRSNGMILRRCSHPNTRSIMSLSG